MSVIGEPKRYVKLIKADKTINDVKFEEKKEQQKQNSKQVRNLRSQSKSPSKISQSYLKTKSLKDEIFSLLSQAKSSKQKINKGLEFVKLVDDFNQEQRCLEHNNVITLYCMHDKKLLCVYCIYGVNKHRSHKLLPPFQHLEFIAKDVYELQQNFNQFLFSLEDVVINSKLTCQLFQKILKNYMGQIEAQYIKRKLQLEQLYESQKKYLTKICQQLIENSKLISNQYEQIKFNIWQCQARYNLDKRLKISSSNPKETNFLQKKTNQQKLKSKQKKLNSTQGKLQKSTSPSKEATKIEKNQINQKQIKKEEKGNQRIEDSEKDYREVLSKHIILSHVVEEMRKIQPIKIDEKEIERKIFNRSMLKLIPHQYSYAQKNPKKKSQINLSIEKQK